MKDTLDNYYEGVTSFLPKDDPILSSKADLLEKQIELIKKFYELSHLNEFTARSYHKFIDEDIVKIISKRGPIKLFTLKDKKDDIDYDYYLLIKKPMVKESELKNQKRQIIEVTNKNCAAKALTRELSLFVNLKLVRTPKDDRSKVEVISAEKRPFLLTKIPLLLNSKFDKYANPNPEFYSFLIKGAYRIIHNTLIARKGIPAIKKDTNEVTLRITSDKENDVNYFYAGLNLNNLNNYACFDSLLGNKQKLNIFETMFLLGLKTESLEQYLIELDQKYKLNASELIALQSQITNLRNQCEENSHVSLIERLKLKKLSLMKYEHSQEKVSRIPLEETVALLEEHLLKNLFYKTNYTTAREKQKVRINKINLMKYYFEELLKVKKDKNVLKYKDHLSDKYIFSYRNHLNSIFESSLDLLLEKMKIIGLKELAVITRSKTVIPLVRPDIMTKNIRNYLTRNSSKTSESFTEVLSSTNNVELIGLQRKIVSDLSKEAENLSYRSVNPLKIGRICCVDTPNSKAVGLVEKLATGAKVSLELDPNILKKLLSLLKLKEVNTGTKVLFNDKYLGYASTNINTILTVLAKLKRNHQIGYNFKEETLNIRTYGGRILKPFFVVKNNKVTLRDLSREEISTYTLQQLIDKDYLIYLDTQEELNYKIAKSEESITENTHCLLLPFCAYLSYSTNILPFINNNAAHRTTLALRILKQALGSNIDSQIFETKNKFEYLVKPSYSMVSTPFEKLYRDVIGFNMVTAFYHGENEEDSTEINKSVLERGGCSYMVNKNITGFFNYNEQENVYSTQELPKEDSATEKDLELDGTLKGGYIKKGGLILKNKVLESNTEVIKKNYLEENSGYVTQVKCEYGTENQLRITYKLSNLMKSNIGDKQGNRTGLKGVIAKCVDEIDLPLPTTGIIPGVFYSIHAINSRMTLGPLMELIISKASALQGKIFQVLPLNQIAESNNYLLAKCKDILIKNNLDPTNVEEFYDPASTKENKIYSGLSKLFLLEQHSLEKCYIRGKSGGVKFLTRQPVQGKANRGGLRFGGMQTEACIEHGATNFLKERMSVDEVKVNICSKCSLMTDQNKFSQEICSNCGEDKYIRSVTIPYAFVLLAKTLKAGHIETLIELEEKQEGNQIDENKNQVNQE